jgi:hypothetical protein
MRKPIDLATLLGLLWRHTGGGPAAAGHDALLYQDADRLADRVASYVRAALEADGVAVICATADRLSQLNARLGNGSNGERTHRIVSLDATRTLEAIRIGGKVSRHRFDYLVGNVIRQSVGTANRPVHVYGEMVDLLWQVGDAEAAVGLEALWNRLRRTQSFPLLCAYRATGGEQSLRPACEQHAVCAVV